MLPDKLCTGAEPRTGAVPIPARALGQRAAPASPAQADTARPRTGSISFPGGFFSHSCFGRSREPLESVWSFCPCQAPLDDWSCQLVLLSSACVYVTKPTQSQLAPKRGCFERGDSAQVSFQRPRAALCLLERPPGWAVQCPVTQPQGRLQRCPPASRSPRWRHRHSSTGVQNLAVHVRWAAAACAGAAGTGLAPGTPRGTGAASFPGSSTQV